MAFATRLTKIGYHSEHFNERTWMCYHQAPTWARGVAHVRDAGQAKPHREHNPLSLLGACNATPIRKLNDPDYWHSRRNIRRRPKPVFIRLSMWLATSRRNPWSYAPP